MLVSELLGLAAFDSASNRVGCVIDVRLAAPTEPETQVPIHVLGLLISPHTRAAYWGYERRDVNSPLLIAAAMRWWHRGTFLVGWEDVARIDDDKVVLRPSFSRYSARLEHGSQSCNGRSP